MSHKYVPQFIRKLLVREAAPSRIVDPSLLLEIQRAARTFKASLSHAALLSFNGRLERGLQLALSGAVHPDPTPTHSQRCWVTSSDGCHSYRVDMDAKSCDCPDSQKANHCKHRLAAFYYYQARKQVSVMRPLSSRTNEELLKGLGFDAVPNRYKGLK